MDPFLVWSFCKGVVNTGVIKYIRNTSQCDADCSLSLMYDLVTCKMEQYSHTWHRSVFTLSITDGRVVREGNPVIWNVVSWSGGHEFKPLSGHTLGALLLLSQVILEPKIQLVGCMWVTHNGVHYGLIRTSFSQTSDCHKFNTKGTC